MPRHGPSIVLGRSPKLAPALWEEVPLRVSSAANVRVRIEALREANGFGEMTAEGMMAYALLRGLAAIEREHSPAPTPDDGPIPAMGASAGMLLPGD